MCQDVEIVGEKSIPKISLKKYVETVKAGLKEIKKKWFKKKLKKHVLEKDVLIIAANQWFDDSFLNETSISNFYFPSVDLKNFNRFKKKFYDTFDYKPNDVTILSYDSVGLIYYLWKKNVKINSVKDFNMKNDIKGKIGKFRISENKVIQKLNIYQLDQNTFVKSNL